MKFSLDSHRTARAVLILLAGLSLSVPQHLAAAADMGEDGAGSFLGRFSAITTVSSTVPANGDVNPYGVAVIHRSTGALVRGNVLVSNFNNAANQQGTGTTIVQVAPNGAVSQFAQIDAATLPGPCPGGVGLTTALVVLRSGWVIVGSLPAARGDAAKAEAGCLIVLNHRGKPVETLSGGVINGPWDMAAVERGHMAALFFTNVLNGTVAAGGNVVNQGTVVRLVLGLGEDDGEDDDDSGLPREVSRTVIGSGFGEKTDPAALVIGPTGVRLGRDGVLYVADTLANRIAGIANATSRSTDAGTGKTVFSGGALNGPLGLAITPNNHILVTNGGDGNMVEVSRSGVQVDVKPVDTTGAGAGTLFGLDIAPEGKGVYFVNDGNNTLDLLH
jgi:hypothetical protein